MRRREAGRGRRGAAVLAVLLVSPLLPAQPPPPPDPGPADTLDAPRPPESRGLLPPAGSAPAPAKSPRPADADLRRAEQEIRSLYKTSSGPGADPAARQALAGKLLQDAERIPAGTDVAVRFALLSEVVELGSFPAGLGTAFRAADALEASVEGVEAVALKAKALAAATKGARTGDDLGTLADRASAVLEQALREESFKAAAAAARSLKAVAQALRDADLLREAGGCEKQIPLLERERAEMEKAAAVLRDRPDAPDAHLTIGRYLCGREDWAAAAAHLAQGADEDLRAAAGWEVRDPSEADGQVSAAEQWEAAARKRRDPLDRERFFGRALFWYQYALASTRNALQAARIERKLAELETEAPGRSVQVTFHWSCADDADVYVNGRPLRTYEPDFRTRPDEAPRAFSCAGRLGRGDVITVGARRGGSYGITLVAVEVRGRIVWKTDARTWRVYFPPAGAMDWYRPSVARGARSEPARQAAGWPPQTQINDRFAGGKAESVWHAPESRTCFLYSVVR